MVLELLDYYILYLIGRIILIGRIRIKADHRMQSMYIWPKVQSFSVFSVLGFLFERFNLFYCHSQIWRCIFFFIFFITHYFIQYSSSDFNVPIHSDSLYIILMLKFSILWDHTLHIVLSWNGHKMMLKKKKILKIIGRYITFNIY